MPKGSKPGQGDLSEYRRKRFAERTPEPFGGAADERPGLFVVHKHSARQLHYDVRLEMDGVLKSWAVPKGPSLDPRDKRLAVLVEDHPLEYADFEGIIPEGNYGAGAVIVWDRGLWVPVADPGHGLDRGKLLFDLRGYKLRGRWTLFKTKRGERDWLLVKKPDAYADASGTTALDPGSVFTGRTVEEMRAGRDPSQAIREQLVRLGAPRGRVSAATVGLMLADSRDEPFSAPGWIFELKYDGYRVVAGREREGQAVLRYRRGQEVTRSFPELAAALGKLPYEGLVMDGELVVLDEDGKPSFQLLQERVGFNRPHDIARASVRLPATLFLFDLLGFEDIDLRPLPLETRRGTLRQLLPRVGPLRFSEHIEERGEEMYEEVRRMGLEGIVAKRAGAAYRAGRSADWLKIRADRTGDFAVVGYTAPKRGRPGFGALHLAVAEAGGLTYAGRVGSGFTEQQLSEIRHWLGAHRRRDPPCSGPVPPGPEHTWVEPSLVCEVRYKEITRDGQLRQPVFLRLREDKSVEECVRREAPPTRAPRRAPAVATVVERAPAEPAFTNLDKTFWPEEGYTKGDLIEYHRAIAPWVLPYLEDRPLVLTRYPDGIHGKSFFQKDAPEFVPEWVRTETMWSEDAEREIRYFICDDERTLLYLANLGTIPLHVWASRIASLQTPDWCILDLDPKGAPFEHVVRVARAIHSLCREIELEAFVKTSGSSGLHVLLPLGGQCSYEQSRLLGELLARVVARELGEIATTARTMAAREGRVYIDYVQNGHGRLLVAPFSARPLPGAPVSMPLRWSEVTPGLDTRRFTIRSAPRRLASLKADPLRGVLETAPDLRAVLERLEARVR
jgi:bifunctional non-homologous end joining protein LigD